MVKKKALFFDRDGTLIRSKLSKNKRPVAIKEFSELKIYPSVKKILEKLNKEYLIFIYTNQPDVGRKINTVSNVKKINNYLVKNLPIKKIYTCYCDSKKCKFRKPNIGAFMHAKKKFNVDLKNSFMIGDRWKDIDAGNSAKCKTILIDKNYNEKIKTKPDYKINSFWELKKIFKF